MQNGTGQIRLIANEPRHKFLARFMATHTKNHKITRRKKRPAVSARRPRASGAPQTPVLAPIRLVEKALASKEIFSKEEEEPRPEDLAKEEPIKPEEVEEATAAIEAEANRAAASEPRTRERSGYDGDTAIKLYLREIGQVKLLTPQDRKSTR